MEVQKLERINSKNISSLNRLKSSRLEKVCLVSLEHGTQPQIWKVNHVIDVFQVKSLYLVRLNFFRSLFVIG